jgi:hypothetical protein
MTRLVEVHHFKVRNPNSGDWEIPPSKRTAYAIAQLGGIVIEDTMESVTSTSLDPEGRYFPPGSAVQVKRPVDEDRKKRRPK